MLLIEHYYFLKESLFFIRSCFSEMILQSSAQMSLHIFMCMRHRNQMVRLELVIIKQNLTSTSHFMRHRGIFKEYQLTVHSHAIMQKWNKEHPFHCDSFV